MSRHLEQKHPATNGLPHPGLEENMASPPCDTTISSARFRSADGYATTRPQRARNKTQTGVLAAPARAFRFLRFHKIQINDSSIEFDDVA